MKFSSKVFFGTESYTEWKLWLEKFYENLYRFTTHVMIKYNKILSGFLVLSWRLKSNKYFQNIQSRVYGISLAKKEHQTLCIEYLYDNQIYRLYVPFERRLVPKMMNKTIELQYENSTRIIQHQPGIPYFITPKHLAAKTAKIYSYNEESLIDENEKIELS